MPSTRTRRQFLTVCGSAALVGAAGCLGTFDDGDDGATDESDATVDWSTAGGDRANTNHVPANPVTNGTTRTWRATVGTVTAQPVVGGGVVYVVAGDLVAFDAADGERRWAASTDEGEGRFWAAPTVHDGTVYIASARRVHALDADSGERAWTRDLDVGSFVTPTVDRSGESLFVGGSGHVTRLDAATGAVEWTHDLFGQVRETVAVHRGVVYAVTEGGELYALGGSGEGYWRVDLPAKCQCPPSVVDDRVYVGTFDGRVHAVDTSRATVAWSTPVGGFAKGGIAVDDTRDTVYVDGGREVHALDADSGERAWAFDVGTTGDHTPVVAGDTVYTTGDRLYALKADGGLTDGVVRQELTRFEHAFGGYAGPMSVAGDHVYVGARLGDGEGNQTDAIVALESE